MADSSSSAADAQADSLLEQFGQTYAQEAGIRLADQPSPLYELLVLATLLSARISADIAVSAARELFAAGYRTPRAMQEASWQDRVDALGRGHYKRYDERTATMLGDGATLARDRWHGDLRRLRDEAGGEPGAIGRLLQEFPGIGPAGAAIFLREAQGVWPSVAPYLDDRVRQGAQELGWPDEPDALARRAGSTEDLARLAAALVRVTLTKNAPEQVRRDAGDRG
jgi:endonuclease III